MNPPTTTPPTNKWRLNINENSSSKLPNKHFFSNFCQNYGVRCSCFVAEEKEMVMGFMLSQRSCVDLIQNCDLPPPLKVFPGKEGRIITTDLSMQQSTPFMISQSKDNEIDRNLAEEDGGLFKALRLSQAREMEAEKKVSLIAVEKDRVSAMFFEESLRSFAHRQWVKLLEIEIEQLQSKLEVSFLHNENGSQVEDDSDGADSTWLMALALCLGIAGVGIALGCRYLV